MSHYAALPRAVALAVPITLGAWTVQAADIIQTAEQVGRFNGFLQLLDAAGMVEMLKGQGPFTVFAPIDEAFGQLPPGAPAPSSACSPPRPNRQDGLRVGPKPTSLGPTELRGKKTRLGFSSDAAGR
jgi:hypothetical protein